MLVPHFQQSATISHTRTDIGAEQSGQGHINTSPCSHNDPEPRRICPLVAGSDIGVLGAAGGDGSALSSGSSGSGPEEFKSSVGMFSPGAEPRTRSGELSAPPGAAEAAPPEIGTNVSSKLESC